jgi:hypothetical protein
MGPGQKVTQVTAFGSEEIAKIAIIAKIAEIENQNHLPPRTGRKSDRVIW